MDSRGEEFGPYRVYEQIGVGGMATVHRAETTGIAGFRKTVALKRMLPHVATNAELVKSFVREARLASHLRHGNVAQTYDLGKVGDIYFIAMELVTGHNLREILQHCVRVQIRIPIPITLHILNQICDALDYAHDLCDDSGQPLGIIHRDVSPSNVIVSESGTAKLIDFGIAKASAAGMQTMSGTVKGKVGYMAPEYLAGTIDARADLFALGIIAYELLTNRPLFTGQDDMDTLHRVRSMPIPHPSAATPDLPDEIDVIVMTALQRDPAKRWQRASAMRVALTTETKRLGMTLLDHQVVDWCEWAFQQKPGGFDRDSEPSMIIIREPATQSPPLELDGPGSLDDDTEDPEDMIHTRVRSSSQPPPKPTRTSAPLAIQRVEAVAATRTVRPPVPTPAAVAPAFPPVPARMSNLAIAVLLVLAAVAAGAVVYFGLPYVL